MSIHFSLGGIPINRDATKDGQIIYRYWQGGNLLTGKGGWCIVGLVAKSLMLVNVIILRRER